MPIEMMLLLVGIVGVFVAIIRYFPSGPIPAQAKERGWSYSRRSGTTTVRGNNDGSPWTARLFRSRDSSRMTRAWTSVSVPAPPVSGHATLIVSKSMSGALALATDLDNVVGRFLLWRLLGKRSALLNGATNVPLPDEISRSVSARSNQPDQVPLSPDGWRLIALQSEMAVIRWPDAVEIRLAVLKDQADELEALASIALQLAAS